LLQMNSAVTSITIAALKAKGAIDSVGQNPIQQDSKTGEPTVKGEESDKWVLATKIGPLALVALVGLTVGFASWYIIESALVDFSSIFVMMAAPAVIYQKRMLAKIGSFREHHNQLRNSIGTFKQENERLSKTVDQLEMHVEG
jgi:hypothetical protein